MVVDRKEIQSPITIDDLAGMIARGFRGVDEKFKETNNNIGILQRDVSELKETTKRIDKRLIAVEDIVLKDHNKVIQGIKKVFQTA